MSQLVGTLAQMGLDRRPQTRSKLLPGKVIEFLSDGITAHSDPLSTEQTHEAAKIPSESSLLLKKSTEPILQGRPDAGQQPFSPPDGGVQSGGALPGAALLIVAQDPGHPPGR